MPRTLPWLTGGAVKKEATPQKRAIKRDPDPESDHDQTPKASKDIGYSDKSDILKSSSPSADPIRRCPSEEYLIEGFDNDDIWMMVEDEFYAVAQTFTQHLHYAEYIRRTKEAKLQNVARIQDLSRPTDGVTPMSEETKKTREAEALAERQKKGLGQLEEKKGIGSGDRKGAGGLDDDDDDDDDALFQDDAWAGTSLYDLMISPRKARSLVDSRGIKSSTKAAAGYAQASQHSGSDARSRDESSAAAAVEPPSSPLGHRAHTVADETASDDDLDIQPKTTFKRTPQDIKAPKYENLESTKLSIAPTKCVSHKPINAMRKSGTKPESTPSIRERNKTSTVPKPRKRMLFDDDFDKLPEPKSNDIPMHDTPTKRNPLLSVGDKQPPHGSRGVDDGIKLESKRSRLNEVPTFLL